MLQPENLPKKYDHLFVDIDCGIIKIPKFQREFIWTKEQTAKLIGDDLGEFLLFHHCLYLDKFYKVDNRGIKN